MAKCDMAYKLGILTTHPIQYKVPWYRALAQRSEVDLTVFYCMMPNSQQQGDGFGVEFEWDIPLLDGYRYEVLDNVTREPSVTRFGGCDTPGITEIVIGRGFDAFIVNGWVVKSCLQVLRACRKHHVPCIVRGESNSLRPRPWWKRVGHRWLLRKYAAFLSIGEANKQFYLDNGVSEDKVFFAPYGVDNERFAGASAQSRARRAELRRHWGVPDAACCFVFCGKFIEKKRPLDLLEALSMAVEGVDQGKDAMHLLMVGDGALRPPCERIARDRGLPVTFTGFLNQSQIAQAYAASDCLVLPSDYGETWGLVVNEAMACGLPAIVSDRVGCHLDLVAPGRTGEVFCFGDRRALAQRLGSFAASPEEVTRMGGAARELVGKYSVASAVEGTVEAVEYACGTAGGAAAASSTGRPVDGTASCVTRKKLFLGFCAALLGLVAVASALEAGLRAFGPSYLVHRMKMVHAGSERQFGTDRGLPIETRDGKLYRYTPLAEFHLGHNEYYHRVKIDAYGGRKTRHSGHGQRGRHLVPFLGDSFTFGVGVEDEETYVSLLECDPDVLYLNLGFTGTCLAEQLDVLGLRHSEFGSPRFYVFSVFLGNDFRDLVEVHRRVLARQARRAAMAQDGAARRRGEGGEGKREANPGDNLSSVDSSVLWRLNEFVFHKSFLKRSYLLQFAKQRLLASMNRRGAPRMDPAFLVMAKNGDYLSKSMQYFEAELERLDAMMQEMRFRCLFVLIPDRNQVSPRVRELNARYYDIDLNKIDPNLPNKALAAALDRHGIPYLDVTDRLRSQERVDALFYTHDSHFTALGHKAAAERLSAEIQRRVRATFRRD